MLLDTKDRKLLEVLDQNPRISLTALAKAIGISQQVADYRLKKLQEKGFVSNFGTIFNLSLLGYEQYRLFFQLHSLTAEKKETLLDFLKHHPRVYWAAFVGSNWDLFVVVFVKNYEELDLFLDYISKKFPNTIKNYDASYTVYHEFYYHKYLHQKKHVGMFQLNFGTAHALYPLDTLDYKIMDIMKNNCRLSSLEMSRTCKVHYKTVQERIKKMEKSGLIVGYRFFLRAEQIAYQGYFLLLSFSHYEKEAEKKIFQYSREKQSTTQTMKLFGKQNLLLHFRVKNAEELQKNIVELRNLCPDIATIEVIPVFQDIAINHFPMSKELIKH